MNLESCKNCSLVQDVELPLDQLGTVCEGLDICLRSVEPENARANSSYYGSEHKPTGLLPMLFCI